MAERLFVRAFTLRACEYAKHQYRAEREEEKRARQISEGVKHGKLVNIQRDLEEVIERRRGRLEELDRMVEKRTFEALAFWYTKVAYYAITVILVAVCLDIIVSIGGGRANSIFLRWIGRLIVHFVFSMVRMLETLPGFL